MPQITMTRRVFIGATAYIVSIPLLASTYQPNQQLLTMVDDGQFFNAAELTILTDVAEIMIPKTDTPGATDLNLSSVLDGLMTSWAGHTTKQQYTFIIQQLSQLASSTYQQKYAELSLEQRTALVTEVDKIAFTSKTSELSKAYRKLKEMIFHVYYNSEQTNPDFVLIPGGYKGDISKQTLQAIQAKGYL